MHVQRFARLCPWPIIPPAVLIIQRHRCPKTFILAPPAVLTIRHSYCTGRPRLPMRAAGMHCARARRQNGGAAARLRLLCSHSCARRMSTQHAAGLGGGMASAQHVAWLGYRDGKHVAGAHCLAAAWHPSRALNSTHRLA